MLTKAIATAIVAVSLAACSAEDDRGQAVNSASGIAAGRWFTVDQMQQGRQLFQGHCAACHGKDGEGAAEWHKVGPDGKYPAPPLNGTGHAWHHPLKALLFTVNNGSPGGAGNMPGWKGKLTDEEILSIIAWFQSHWPDELYQAWAKAQNQ